MSKNYKLIAFSPEGMGLFFTFLNWLSQEGGLNLVCEARFIFDWAELNGVDGASISPSMVEEVLGQVKVWPTQVQVLKFFDSFFCESGSWYPRVCVTEFLRSLLVHEAKDLDIRSPAFIVGDGIEVRAIASFLAEMGFRKFYFVNPSDSLEAQKKFLSQAHFGCTFEVVPVEVLTLQSLNSSIVINTLNLSTYNELLTDLSYFNFMKSDGYVVDLSLYSAQNLLLIEAAKAGLRPVAQEVLVSYMTQYWLDRIGISHSFSHSDLQQKWKQFMG